MVFLVAEDERGVWAVIEGQKCGRGNVGIAINTKARGKKVGAPLTQELGGKKWGRH